MHNMFAGAVRRLTIAYSFRLSKVICAQVLEGAYKSTQRFSILQEQRDAWLVTSVSVDTQLPTYP